MFWNVKLTFHLPIVLRISEAIFGPVANCFDWFCFEAHCHLWPKRIYNRETDYSDQPGQTSQLCPHLYYNKKDNMLCFVSTKCISITILYRTLQYNECIFYNMIFNHLFLLMQPADPIDNLFHCNDFSAQISRLSYWKATAIVTLF